MSSTTELTFEISVPGTDLTNFLGKMATPFKITIPRLDPALLSKYEKVTLIDEENKEQQEAMPRKMDDEDESNSHQPLKMPVCKVVISSAERRRCFGIAVLPTPTKAPGSSKSRIRSDDDYVPYVPSSSYKRYSHKKPANKTSRKRKADGTSNYESDPLNDLLKIAGITSTKRIQDSFSVFSRYKQGDVLLDLETYAGGASGVQVVQVGVDPFLLSLYEADSDASAAQQPTTSSSLSAAVGAEPTCYYERAIYYEPGLDERYLSVELKQVSEGMTSDGKRPHYIVVNLPIWAEIDAAENRYVAAKAQQALEKEAKEQALKKAEEEAAKQAPTVDDHETGTTLPITSTSGEEAVAEVVENGFQHAVDDVENEELLATDTSPSTGDGGYDPSVMMTSMRDEDSSNGAESLPVGGEKSSNSPLRMSFRCANGEWSTSANNMDDNMEVPPPPPPVVSPPILIT